MTSPSSCRQYHIRRDITSEEISLHSSRIVHSVETIHVISRRELFLMQRKSFPARTVLVYVFVHMCLYKYLHLYIFACARRVAAPAPTQPSPRGTQSTRGTRGADGKESPARKHAPPWAELVVEPGTGILRFPAQRFHLRRHERAGERRANRVDGWPPMLLPINTSRSVY